MYFCFRIFSAVHNKKIWNRTIRQFISREKKVSTKKQKKTIPLTKKVKQHCGNFHLKIDKAVSVSSGTYYVFHCVWLASASAFAWVFAEKKSSSSYFFRSKVKSHNKTIIHHKIDFALEKKKKTRTHTRQKSEALYSSSYKSQFQTIWDLFIFICCCCCSLNFTFNVNLNFCSLFVGVVIVFLLAFLCMFFLVHS